WHYKITWNPKNIIMAGKDGAVYKKDKAIINIDYKDVFAHGQPIKINSLAPMAWYPNRDSLKYIDLYNLHSVDTFLRTTLRYPSFCIGWNYFVHLGLTDVDDHYIVQNSKSFSDWFTAKQALQQDVGAEDQTLITELENFLDINRTSSLPASANCSADVIQYLFEEKLNMEPSDKDMIVMLHEIEFTRNNKNYKTTSSLIVKGLENGRTAMAKTVGLPLGIAAELILDNKISLKGVQIPVHKDIYLPALKRLEEEGIIFNEKTEEIG
ncbi:MAG: saccharopine dehydrogenase C-terminal domain-containing protein, partial [Ginsengibacter sp.]